MSGTISDLVARLATDADFLDRKIMHGTAPAIARDIREAAEALTRLEQAHAADKALLDEAERVLSGSGQFDDGSAARSLLTKLKERRDA